jgi:Na+/H+-translocating membrane pyrophosphatase
MAGFVVPFVFFAGIVGLIWAIYNYKKLSDVNVKPMDEGEEESGKKLIDGFDPVSIGAIIQEGASEFIIAEYKICSLFIIIMAAIVYVCVD